MNRDPSISLLIALSTAIMLVACGGGGDPVSAGPSSAPDAPGIGTLPCPVLDANGLCVTPGSTGGTSPTTPPTTTPTTPPTAPPSTATSAPPSTLPSANTDPCVIPVPGFSASYRNSAKPGLTISTVTTGSASAPVETTTFAADGVTVASRNELKISMTASGGPQLSWNKIRTETTATGMSTVQEYSVAQTLNLPMLPGDSQTTGGAVSGTHTIMAPGLSCSGTVSGSQVVTYTYAGIDQVTVPAGTFGACRFSVTRVSDIKTSCDDGHGSGQLTDTTALWVLDGHIIKSVGSDGSVTELLSYTP